MKIINENTFDINKFKGSNLAVNCKTEEDAIMFLEMLNNDYDINWDTNRKFSMKNKEGKFDVYWGLSFDKTVYRWHKHQVLVHDSLKYLFGRKIETVEFKSLNNKNKVEEMLNTEINWKDFINGKFAIHCKRESEVNELLQWIYKSNKEDEIKNSPLEILGEGWGTWEEDICYYVNYGCIGYCDKSNCNRIILEWNNKYEYRIDGVIETELSEDEFNNKFIDWVESIGGTFGGEIE